ncbi:MAG: flippase [bacterium]|nr:flippase [bacterium]
MKLFAQIAHNTIIQIIGKIISTILGLAALAIMARYLKQTGFGQYITIITFLSFFGIMADFGLTLVTSQMVSQPQADQAKLLNNLFSLRLVSACLLLLFAPLAIFFFPYEPIIKYGAAIASLSFFFTALNQILVGWFQNNLTMAIVAAADVAGKIALLAGIILTARFNLGLLSIMAATFISGLISFIIHYWFARRRIKIGWQINFEVWRAIIKKSWPLGVTIFFNLIYLRADALILSLLKSQGEVGLYGAAYRIIDVLTALPFMFAGLILPILTRIWAERDAARFNLVLQKSLDAMFILAVPLIIGAQITAKPLMRLIAGEHFILAGDILKILILAVGFIFMSCLLTHAAIAMDKQKKLIPAYIFTALTALAGYLILIPLYSYYGAAWVTVYSEIAISLFSLYAVIKYGRFRLKINILLKSLAASLIMVLIVYWLIDKYSLFFIIPLAAIAYLACLYAFKGISKKDLTGLLN